MGMGRDGRMRKERENTHLFLMSPHCPPAHLACSYNDDKNSSRSVVVEVDHVGGRPVKATTGNRSSNDDVWRREECGKKIVNQILTQESGFGTNESKKETGQKNSPFF